MTCCYRNHKLITCQLREPSNYLIIMCMNLRPCHVMRVAHLFCCVGWWLDSLLVYHIPPCVSIMSITDMGSSRVYDLNTALHMHICWKNVCKYRQSLVTVQQFADVCIHQNMNNMLKSQKLCTRNILLMVTLKWITSYCLSISHIWYLQGLAKGHQNIRHSFFSHHKSAICKNNYFLCSIV